MVGAINSNHISLLITPSVLNYNLFDFFTQKILIIYWLSFFWCLFSACLPSIRLYSFSYESLHKFGIQIWSYITYEYNKDRYFLNTFLCFLIILCAT
ncbi:hypothetical protein HU200_047911 [Digitaria exilis]|uniref:Uncharacterized protein n=1 Tax=Digitaria exilis TaxID=1010633 RepID=A0A835AWG6_9POAL|nr:hypothetical protein HU200_047911 [Digitaria exilis]